VRERDGSPYQEIQRKNKDGENMMSTLRWGDEEPIA